MVMNGHDEQGSALIMVLSVLAVLTVMIAHVTVFSEILGLESKVVVERSRLRYRAESGIERGFWLHLQDRRRQTSRFMGAGVGVEQVAGERWQADGRGHRLAYGEDLVEVRILDANSGIDISGVNPDRALRQLLPTTSSSPAGGAASAAALVVVNRFFDVLLDYVDRGDAVRLAGKEAPGYAAEGYPGMPRNGPLQYRSELLWLEGVEALAEMMAGGGENAVAALLGCIRPIPPRGREFRQNLKPSFFSSSPLLLQRLARLDDEELEWVLGVRRSWQAGDLEELTFPEPGLEGRLRAQFSFQESAVVVIQALAQSSDAEVRREVEEVRPAVRFVRTRGTRRVIENWGRISW